MLGPLYHAYVFVKYFRGQMAVSIQPKMHRYLVLPLHNKIRECSAASPYFHTPIAMEVVENTLIKEAAALLSLAIQQLPDIISQPPDFQIEEWLSFLLSYFEDRETIF